MELVQNVSCGTDNCPDSFLVFLPLFVVQLWTNTHQTDNDFITVTSNL